MDYVLTHWQLSALVLGVIILIFCYRWVLALCGVILVPDDSVGVMTKKFVIFGKNRRLPAGRIIALNGEAGYQADTLPPGLHMGLWPWQYQVELVKFCTVPPGKVGCVQACDGKPLQSGRTVAQLVSSDAFTAPTRFLGTGGL